MPWCAVALAPDLSARLLRSLLRPRGGRDGYYTWQLQNSLGEIHQVGLRFYMESSTTVGRWWLGSTERRAIEDFAAWHGLGRPTRGRFRRRVMHSMRPFDYQSI